jgi:hypothetical protein
VVVADAGGSTQQQPSAPALVAGTASTGATPASGQQQQQGGASSASQSGNAGNSGNSAAAANNGYAVTLKEVQERPEVIRQVGPNGITTIINNSFNNVRITETTNMNVIVQGYDFVAGMRRVSNITTQAVTQGIFLPGLN